MIKKNIWIKLHLKLDKPMMAFDFIHNKTRLSEDKIAEAFIKGSFFMKVGGKIIRVYKNIELKDKDYIEFNFDEKILLLNTFEKPFNIYDSKHYGVWFKPAGVLAQGNQWGDHTSLLRAVEKIKKKAYLIHRLDREVSGLMILAYTEFGASELSPLFQNNKIKKNYLLKCVGLVREKGEINLSLDGKKAQTFYSPIAVGENWTNCEVNITTGRLHQIRRHFNLIGHPIVGDPAYGKNNKNKEGLCLIASMISFYDPFFKKKVEYKIPENYIWF